MEIALLWIVFSVAVSIWAARRGRSAIGWLFVALALSPLGAAALLIVLPDRSVNGTPTPATHVICPDCRELVRKDARACKHCGARLVPLVDPAREVSESEQAAGATHGRR